MTNVPATMLFDQEGNHFVSMPAVGSVLRIGGVRYVVEHWQVTFRGDIIRCDDDDPDALLIYSLREVTP